MPAVDPDKPGTRKSAGISFNNSGLCMQPSLCAVTLFLFPLKLVFPRPRHMRARLFCCWSKTHFSARRDSEAFSCQRKPRGVCEESTKEARLRIHGGAPPTRAARWTRAHGCTRSIDTCGFLPRPSRILDLNNVMFARVSHRGPSLVGCIRRASVAEVQ